jgi:hypothetical protein
LRNTQIAVCGDEKRGCVFMERVIPWFERNASGRNLGLAIVASIAVVIAMSYATQVLVYDVYGDFTMPDTRLFYTLADLQAIFASIGPEGLMVWAQVHLLDYAFPLAYSFAMAFGIILELGRVYPERNDLKKLIMFPLLGCIMDYLENIFILSQILSYPNLSEFIVIIASTFTVVKWIALALGFIVIIGLAIIILFNRIKSR